jgi:HD-like signal output (HDOD) protein
VSSSSTDLVRGVLQRFHAPDHIRPALPSVALDVVRKRRRPTLNLARVAWAIEQDPVLAAHVLRLAQSPLYGGHLQVRAVAEALVRVGFERVGAIVLEAALAVHLFCAPGYDGPMAKLRKHSQATAHMARAVSKHTYLPGDYAFYCGLLHDVGIAAILNALAALPGGAAPPLIEDVWPSILRSHEEVSGLLANRWGLSSELELVMGHHHEYSIGQSVHALTCVVFVAGALATEAGAGCDEVFSPNAAETACGALGIARDTLKALRATAAEIARLVKAHDSPALR